MKISTPPGGRFPAFCTPTGKTFFAFFPVKQVPTHLQHGRRKYTEHTPLSISNIYEDLRRTRYRGFAISEQEYEDGVNAVAAPILDGRQFPLAAMAVVGPAFRLTPEHLMKVGQTLRATADAIAQDIGLALQFS